VVFPSISHLVWLPTAAGTLAERQRLMKPQAYKWDRHFRPFRLNALRSRSVRHVRVHSQPSDHMS
jgi:hypothetical protein